MVWVGSDGAAMEWGAEKDRGRADCGLWLWSVAIGLAQRYAAFLHSYFFFSSAGRKNNLGY